MTWKLSEVWINKFLKSTQDLGLVKVLAWDGVQRIPHFMRNCCIYQGKELFLPLCSVKEDICRNVNDLEQLIIILVICVFQVLFLYPVVLLSCLIMDQNGENFFGQIVGIHA